MHWIQLAINAGLLASVFLLRRRINELDDRLEYRTTLSPEKRKQFLERYNALVGHFGKESPPAEGWFGTHFTGRYQPPEEKP